MRFCVEFAVDLCVCLCVYVYVCVSINFRFRDSDPRVFRVKRSSLLQALHETFPKKQTS